MSLLHIIKLSENAPQHMVDIEPWNTTAWRERLPNQESAEQVLRVQGDTQVKSHMDTVCKDFGSTQLLSDGRESIAFLMVNCFSL